LAFASVPEITYIVQERFDLDAPTANYTTADTPAPYSVLLE
jgi:hypothetical protein